MNKWSKYGGIMPETYNTSIISKILNRTITEQGGIITNNGFYIGDYFPIKSGKYKISFIANSETTYATRRLRIHLYDENKNSIRQLIVDNIAPFETNDIFTYYLDVDVHGFLRYSIAQECTILNLEKLT